VHLGYTVLYRGAVLARLGRFSKAREDLAEAEAIATGGDTQLDDLAARVALLHGQILLMEGRWEECRQHLERAQEAGVRGGGTGLEVPAMTFTAEALQHEGRAAEAVELLQRSVDHPRALPAERVLARARLAAALAGEGRSREAADQARQTLDEAERMGLRPAAARAAAVIASLAEAHRPHDAGGLLRRGREAWARFLAAIPAEDLAGVRQRADLAPLFGIYDVAQSERSTEMG
jgi:tetratricopeptide (TPR) repeat protein